MSIKESNKNKPRYSDGSSSSGDSHSQDTANASIDSSIVSGHHRLKDLTRRIEGDSRPKQFCRILGGKSLFGQARVLLGRGWLWNTFVTVGRAATFLEVLCSQVPEAVVSITRALADSVLELAYRSLSAVDFSRDVLVNQSRRLLVLRDQTSGWADLGSPARVFDTLTRNGIQPEWAREGERGVLNFNEVPEANI
jgi:hypothetical protein